MEGLRTRLPEKVPLQCNAAVLLEIDKEIATSGDKPTDADILAFIRGESPSDEEDEDESEVKGKPPACPASFGDQHGSKERIFWPKEAKHHNGLF